MQVHELMTRDVVTIEMGSSVGDAVLLMLDRDVRHVPVVDRGELTGVVSDRDLRGFLTPIRDGDNVSRRRGDMASSIADVMQGDVVSVTPDDDVSDVIDLMIDYKIGAVPVIGSDEGRLLGIVSYIDVLREARDLL